MNIEEAVNRQTKLIIELNERISTLEYLLTQTMAIIFKNVSDADSTLLKMQENFTNKVTENGTKPTGNSAGFAAAERVFTSIRSCLSNPNDTSITKQ